LRKKTDEIEVRFQPSSAIMGLNMIPKENRAPDWKKRSKKLAASTYQPKKMREEAAFFGEKTIPFRSECVSKVCPN